MTTIQINFVLPIIKMSEKTLKLDNIKVNRKVFHKTKQPIDLSLVDINKIVISDKLKYGDDGFKYFIGYKEDDIVKPSDIILRQMNGYIKCLENRGKNIAFIFKMIVYWLNTIKFGTRLKKD